MSRKYRIPDNQMSMFDVDLIEDDTPSMPVFDKSRCEARLINYETAARMVETYHYAHRVPSIKIALGLFIDSILSGCICYGTPAIANQRRGVCGEKFILNMLELNRLYVHDYAGKNCESWLIGQSFKYLQDNTNYFILLSYADEGQGHYGYVYQATNWLYTGKVIESNVGAIINGVEYHNQSINDWLGTRSVKKIKDVDPDAVIIKGTPKHRYVYFLGSKSQRKKSRKVLKWPVLPYPKANSTSP